MTQRTWVILGATSIIAEHFARLVAQAGHTLRLVGRDKHQLILIAQDIRLRYQVPCEVVLLDLDYFHATLDKVLKRDDNELDIFIGHSDFTDNSQLNAESIKQLVQVNITATALLIHEYFAQAQTAHNLLYLSSVAASRGRAKNSLYGASKAAIEVYLSGLQQAATRSQRITIARLGFIDTKQTYGLPGIFYAAPPADCAKACLQALKRNKKMFYYPGFWRGIMAIINKLPFFMFKRMKEA